ncbi:unnamed protein product [Ceutorhynchus assimilis]|uniref:Conserved oligomeric Golgi complex subunit 8 n=1 Tax=Ceutorhynchus assimilis TaxID=467358 RepID=A0A9N9MLH1_9CUCU|nr:unnamed protein product [Ceutorhynchus assimilis]
MSTDLLNLLYPNGYPDDWQYDKNIKDYLAKLGQNKVEDLLKQPRKLQLEYANVQDQTQDLAVSNYKTFIETAECSRELFTQFNSIEHKLDELIVDLPKFQQECGRFSEATAQISHLRKLNSLTLSKNAQLLEILELPQLMNSFISDQLYDDALELANYVQKICNKHIDIEIFKSILQDVNKLWLKMLLQLLNELKSDINLPKCLQIVGHLRRMKVFNEIELQLKFLQARGCYLENCLKYIPKNEQFLSKFIEVSRVNLFNIITQFKAIFNENDLIFFTWINNRIEDFLQVLRLELNSSNIDSVMDQCMYFALSFSKIGCDFRSLLLPIFTKQLFINFNDNLQEALIVYEKSIENFTLINKNLPNIPWKSQDPLHPPDSLLEFYPLAEYLNNLLKILNNYKQNAPLSLTKKIINLIQNSLILISKSLLKLYLQEHQAFNSTSRDAFTRLCMSFSDDLIPYVQKCIHVIYPPSQIAAKLGVSVREENLTYLDKDLIVEPIRHLLPNKIEFDEQ